MKLLIQPTTPPPEYDRQTRKLRPRELRFELDGWPLLADNLQDAIKEAALMGEPVTEIEPDH